MLVWQLRKQAGLQKACLSWKCLADGPTPTLQARGIAHIHIGIRIIPSCSHVGSMQAVAPEYRPAYVSWSAQEALSKLRVLKVYTHSSPHRQGGPRVFAQVRELAQAFGRGATAYWHRWYKKDGRPKSYETFLASLRADESDWRPSAHMALQFRPPWSAAAVRSLLPEVVCSIPLLLGHLLDWAVRLRKPYRQEAADMLRDIMTKVLPFQYTEISEAAWQLPPRGQLLCNMKPAGEHTSCCHCVQVFEKATRIHGVPKHPVSYTELLLEVYRARDKCMLLHKWCFQLVSRAACLLESCFSEGHAWPCTAEQLPATRSRMKRMRLDHDMVGPGLRDMVTGKRFRSAAGAIRAGNVDASKSTSYEHEEGTMKRYLAASMTALENKHQLSLSTDESMVGGEGTMVGALWSHTAGKGCWAPPQAFRRHLPRAPPQCNALTPPN